MSDAEVALELLKLALNGETPIGKSAKEPDRLLELYRKCLAAVRKPVGEA